MSVRAAGLTPKRYMLLLTIKGSRGERLTISDLSELLQLAQNTVTEANRSLRGRRPREPRGSNDGRPSPSRSHPRATVSFVKRSPRSVTITANGSISQLSESLQSEDLDGAWN